ncbi:MAG: M23 family metallopeptidase [bacterium]|nr:M23 family metallopeptidase [bacterium]
MRVLWLLLIGLLGLGAGYLMTRFEQAEPQIRTLVAPVWVGQEYEHEFRLSDEGTGLEAMRVWLSTGDQEYELLNETYPGNVFTGADMRVERAATASIKPKELGLGDGPATLHAWVRDWSWSGNTQEVEIEIHIDTKAPRVSLATGLTYVRRGGSEMVVYSLREKVKKHGVALGDLFFPGFPHPEDPSVFLALYALPPDLEDSTRPKVIATDLAGNESSVGLTVELIDRSFANDTIRLSDSFINRKIGELLGSANGSSPVENYLKINRDMRNENAATIREITSQSSGDRIWSGRFLQLPSSQRRAGFAERRTYMHNGKPVDKQTHLGLDLASTSHAKVPAANDGVVVFADDLGIYGNCVILDHGLGLFSLYGHLSEIAVEKGQVVSLREELGKTGATGLAGGDHLHFSMIVSGLFVDPLEWFDERWINEHIEPKLRRPTKEN